MSDAPFAECGHACCDDRGNPHHDHWLDPDECPRCALSGERLSQMRDDLTVVWRTGTDKQAALDGLTLLAEVERLQRRVNDLEQQVSEA